MPLTRWIEGERVALSQQCQTFEDRFVIVLLAVKDRAVGFGQDAPAGLTLPALAALARVPELAQVVAAEASIINALLIPAEGAGRG